MLKTVYDYIEIDSTDKFELRKQESAGFEIYGVRRDLRQDHETFIKLRRPFGKEKS
jgi:hypothetical protein